MSSVKELLLDVVNNRNFKYKSVDYTKIKVWKVKSNIIIIKYINRSIALTNIRNLKTGLFISINHSKDSYAKKCFSIYDMTNLNEKYQKQNIKLINMVLSTFCGYKSVSVSYEYNQLTIKYKVFNKIEFESMIKVTETSPVVLWV